MSAKVFHADLWGGRDEKYRFLLTHHFLSTDWHAVESAEPFYLFEPFDPSEIGDYRDWPAINDVMPVNVTGIVTARDDFVIDFERDPLLGRIAALRDPSRSDDAIRKRCFPGKGSKRYPPGDSRGWKLPEARKKLRSDIQWDRRCAPILYRPFDERQI